MMIIIIQVQRRTMVAVRTGMLCNRFSRKRERERKKEEKETDEQQPLLSRVQCGHQWLGMTNRREKAISSQGRVSKGAFCALAISYSSCHYLYRGLAASPYSNGGSYTARRARCRIECASTRTISARARSRSRECNKNHDRAAVER